MILGAHVSCAGGVPNSVDNAVEVGCTSFQIFTKNQRQWSAPPLPEEDISAFRKKLTGSGLGPVISHDSYLINLANPKEDVHRRSIEAFADELSRCSLLGIKYLVTHPGSHLGEGEKKGIRRIVQGLDASMSLLDEEELPMVLLETTAGQGTNLGYRFEHLAEIIEGSSMEDRFGVCMDTCHSFCAGYDIRSKSSYLETMKEFDRIIGLNRLKAVHLNDTKKKLGSRIDRHANIGDGEIGTGGFSNFMNDDRLSIIPGILETPGGQEAYRKDLKVLRSLIGPSSPVGRDPPD
ncbi:MAG: deoxyribonuclease IV [Candidatus Thermoplasmatota archaeon]|nr:deoxyribonuclease IV [Candidatus Thermoplasmatota archaeon]